MNLFQNLEQMWNPIRNSLTGQNLYSFTKKASKIICAPFIFILTFCYYAVTKPEKITVQMSKTAEKVSEIKIPVFLRKRFFGLYAKKYGVNLDQLLEPLQNFQTFSAFFTRQVKARPIDHNPNVIICPADSKILKISEIQEDRCQIIKGAQYSMGELITGEDIKYTKEQMQGMKKNRSNKLYQVIFYLAPGDYHRFHTPTDFFVEETKAINGALYSVSEKTLLKRKKVYEKNARLCVHGAWSQGYLGMIMVGALNVGRIIVKPQGNFSKGEQMGYFNLGSTIVMFIEGKDLQWNIQEGEKVSYGQNICRKSD